jgi:hypothetical protein
VPDISERLRNVVERTVGDKGDFEELDQPNRKFDESLRPAMLGY